jgi:hypothetical protein
MSRSDPWTCDPGHYRAITPSRSAYALQEWDGSLRWSEDASVWGSLKQVSTLLIASGSSSHRGHKASSAVYDTHARAETCLAQPDLTQPRFHRMLQVHLHGPYPSCCGMPLKRCLAKVHYTRSTFRRYCACAAMCMRNLSSGQT